MKPHAELSAWHHAALLPLLLSLVDAGTVEPDPIGQSPQIQDGFLYPVPATCPVSQDGVTSTAFPWTHAPTCLSLMSPASESASVYCVYTNAAFNDGRGISVVTTPESAAELGSEVWETGVGRGRAEEGLWEARQVEGKGLGLFAKRGIDPGETVILESPVLVVSRDGLASTHPSQTQALLEKAVEQLPARTRDVVMALSRRGGENQIGDMLNVNSMGAKVWDGTSHLIVVPEAAVCLPLPRRRRRRPPPAKKSQIIKK